MLKITIVSPFSRLSSGAPFYQDYLAHYFNPSEDVRATASCINDCAGVTYNWLVKYYDGTGFVEHSGWDQFVTGKDWVCRIPWMGSVCDR